MKHTMIGLFALGLLASPAAAEERKTAELVLVSPDEAVEMRVDGDLKIKGTLATVATAPGTVKIEFRGSSVQTETVNVTAGERVLIVFSPKHAEHRFSKVVVNTGGESKNAKKRAAGPKVVPAAPAVVPAAPAIARIEASADGACATAIDCGSVEILSPNVFGQIAVNGDVVGYPPLVVKNVSEGVAKIEVRVEGTVQGLSQVRVQPGYRTKVIVLSRSQAMIYKKNNGPGVGAPVTPAGGSEFSASLPLEVVTVAMTKITK